MKTPMPFGTSAESTRLTRAGRNRTGNAHAENKIEKMANLLHLCREAFYDIEKHCIDRRPESMGFWLRYISEIAYTMNGIITKDADKYELPINPPKGTEK